MTGSAPGWRFAWTATLQWQGAHGLEAGTVSGTVTVPEGTSRSGLTGTVIGAAKEMLHVPGGGAVVLFLSIERDEL